MSEHRGQFALGAGGSRPLPTVWGLGSAKDRVLLRAGTAQHLSYILPQNPVTTYVEGAIPNSQMKRRRLPGWGTVRSAPVA